MDFKCSCGTVVAKGEIKQVGIKKKLLLDKKPKGIVIRNSKDPKNWEFKCSKCQSGKNEKD